MLLTDDLRLCTRLFYKPLCTRLFSKKKVPATAMKAQKMTVTSRFSARLAWGISEQAGQARAIKPMADVTVS
jgi:hypothetical protein